MAEYNVVGMRCPVPNCEGFVKYGVDNEVDPVCDCGHILSWGEDEDK